MRFLRRRQWTAHVAPVRVCPRRGRVVGDYSPMPVTAYTEGGARRDALRRARMIWRGADDVAVVELRPWNGARWSPWRTWTP